MNTVALTGRLTKDIDYRVNNDTQKAVAKFILAVDRYSNGEKTADFIPCVAFGRTADTLDKFCKKGSMVGVAGSIKTGSYEKDGHKVYTTDIWVDRIDLLTPKEEKKKVDGFEQLTDDDIPF